MRNKSYAIINITGLTVGVAAALLIYLITSYHLSFDNYHSKKGRIYRVITEGKSAEGTHYNAGVPFPVTRGLREDFPQLSKVASVLSSGNDQITVLEENGQPGKKYKETRGFYFAEPELFDILDFKWLSGNAKTLADPYTIVLSREIANKYFGDWTKAIGRSIKFENQDLMKVTGIIEDVPDNSDIPLKLVASFKSFKSENLNDWVSIYSSHNCFVLLPDNYQASTLYAQFPAFIKKHKPAENVNDGIALQALTDMHFDTRVGTFSRRTFSKELITALTLIGVFLLVIACVNFINLATAQAVNR
ncbi:MAG TPA: ABC transporter permease, partial [Nitrososphaera sp.]|nr:ABC transporter permease [Nitrososphaera sp.]